jgi:hypothetical protein
MARAASSAEPWVMNSPAQYVMPAMRLLFQELCQRMGGSSTETICKLLNVGHGDMQVRDDPRIEQVI